MHHAVLLRPVHLDCPDFNTFPEWPSFPKTQHNQEHNATTYSAACATNVSSPHVWVLKQFEHQNKENAMRLRLYLGLTVECVGWGGPKTST